MTAQILKRLFVSILIVVLGAGIGYADGTPDETPIILTPIKNTDGPHVPKSPSVLRLSAYYDGDAVVITSNVDMIAQVSIFDTASGQSYYNSVVAIAPQCRCQVVPDTSGMLTLQITVGDTTFEGTFSLR